ncbi:unnamed protein product [Pleuronectes platessa]|uniref:Uncharacterized protein n=1 Tax=Pleuronectes platessa TaxID=8262 RepID=A0A9N7YES0_PLEPL|nr:unnamed protein product [Pleuronectes platessa]
METYTGCRAYLPPPPALAPSAPAPPSHRSVPPSFNLAAERKGEREQESPGDAARLQTSRSCLLFPSLVTLSLCFAPRFSHLLLLLAPFLLPAVLSLFKLLQPPPPPARLPSLPHTERHSIPPW